MHRRASTTPPTFFRERQRSMARELSFFLLSLLVLVVVVVDGSQSPVISRIAFGSCSNQSAHQPIWGAVIDFDPQLFIWLGDNIYGDNKHPFRLFGEKRTIGPWKNIARFYPSLEEEMRMRYAKAKNNPGYSRLRERAQIIGTWDDHDYGLNDAGKEFSEKYTNQKLLLDFLDEPEDSPRRKQEGVYASYLFGPEGKQIKISCFALDDELNLPVLSPIDVILLDTRYHRDPLFSDGSILGHSQWEWLERELNGPKSEITIIASSIQVVSNISATLSPLFSMESWGHFPKERERLYKLIMNSKRDGVFFISGDAHFGEITRYDCGGEYPLYDITSSGLTQAVEEAVPPSLSFLLRFIAWLTPTTMRVYGRNCRYRSCTYAQKNFGAIDIQWNATPQTIKVELRDVYGRPVTGVDILLSELQHGGMHRVSEKIGSYKHHCSLEIDLPWFIKYRVAFIFAGALAVLVASPILLSYLFIYIGKKFLWKFKTD